MAQFVKALATRVGDLPLGTHRALGENSVTLQAIVHTLSSQMNTCNKDLQNITEFIKIKGIHSKLRCRVWVVR